MKIGIDASRANRNFKTGTEWYSYYLIINIIKLDKQNQYILYSDKPLSEFFLENLNLEENKNVKIKVLNWPFKFFWTLGRLSLEMIIASPDVLFVPAHSIPLFSPRKTITTIHDIAFIKNKCLYNVNIVDFESNFIKRVIKFFVKIFTMGKCKLRSSDYLNWSTKLALKKSKKIITVSDFTKKEIINNYKVDENKVVKIYNGFNSLLYKQVEKDQILKNILSSYGLLGPYFLYVGRIEKKKNIALLIEAFGLYREKNKESKEKLVLVGNIGYGSDEVRFAISELELFKEVVMLGWVEEDNMPYIFNGAEAFVFPSLYEGFGIPILQSMACGVPVIASDIEALREVGGDSLMFFDPFSAEDLSLKFELINQDKEFRNNLISSGLDRSKKFSWEKCAKETLDEIKKL